ncbi:MAG: UvrD-helicase domain-containing protein [Bacteroidales bacterium]|nr:UvrD-helicase domain-containing protein [Bacteroidales bacterium]
MTNNIDTILEGLDGSQRQAVECVEGPVLIVAGAGSGKTRVLTSRIAYILAGGCSAERILALTFTKKAAGEMKERIAAMVGSAASRRLVMGTFHSVFVRFLRDWAGSIGYSKDFTIYDQSDSVSAIRACIKELQLDDKVYKPKDVLSRISSAKNNLVTAGAYRSNPKAIASDTQHRKPRICDIYSLYETRCRQSSVMDFDDILLNLNILLKDHPEALQDIAGRFSYIMVDEYQDTNLAQYIVLKKLAAPHHNICVVGDDSQSIYAFRGARIENILNFRKDYPESRIFRLERNYRSTRNIVGAANSLIAKNSNRIPKECYSDSEDGARLHLMRAYTEQEESILVAGDILTKLRTDGAAYRDFAVLYRTNAQSRALEESLRRRNIPYMIYSGNSFFERQEVKDLMAYFKLCVNASDDESFKRAVNRPARGIGATSMEALIEAARSASLPLSQAALQEGLGLKAASIAKIRLFCEMMEALRSELHAVQADVLARKIADRSSVYAHYKEDTSIEGQARLANIDELLNNVTQFVEERQEELLAEMPEPDETQLPVVTLGDYLENVSLLSAVDAAEDEEDAGNKVALMTVHSAKGLEFPYVYVVGMEENLFPSGMGGAPADTEEERRLFYVALTRAQRSVVLSYAESRMRNGQHESNPPSRFLREIDDRFIDNPLGSSRFASGRPGFVNRPSASGPSSWGRSSAAVSVGRPAPKFSTGTGSPVFSARPSAPAHQDVDFAADPVSAFRVGQEIEHSRFGYGTIIAIDGEFPRLKATINFEGYGQKYIMLDHAKIRLKR